MNILISDTFVSWPIVKDGNLMIPIIEFIPRNAFISSSVVSELQTFCAAYLFVSVTMIFRSSFIPVTVWNMSKGVMQWSRSTITSASKVHSFFIIGFSLSSHFHSSVVLVFFFFVLSSPCGTLPFSGLCCSRRMEYWPFPFLFQR